MTIPTIKYDCIVCRLHVEIFTVIIKLDTLKGVFCAIILETSLPSAMLQHPMALGKKRLPNMNDFRVCSGCLQEKPLSEFYIRKNGKPNSRCIVCAKLQKKHQTPDQLMKSGVKSEQRVIDLLNSMGIPSMTGKAVSHAYADIVSWGCVLIETKTSKREGLRDAMFVWAFSEPQKRIGLRADLIVLECEWATDDYTYHVFHADDARFYNDKGLKGVVTYTFDRRKPVSSSSSFTKDVIEAHQDRWDMITEKRLEVEANLRNGQSWLIHDRLKVG